MKMGKRITAAAVLLCVAIVATMMPTMAFAAETVDDTEVPVTFKYGEAEPGEGEAWSSVIDDGLSYKTHSLSQTYTITLSETEVTTISAIDFPTTITGDDSQIYAFRGILNFNDELMAPAESVTVPAITSDAFSESPWNDGITVVYAPQMEIAVESTGDTTTVTLTPAVGNADSEIILDSNVIQTIMVGTSGANPGGTLIIEADTDYELSPAANATFTLTTGAVAALNDSVGADKLFSSAVLSAGFADLQMDNKYLIEMAAAAGMAGTAGTENSTGELPIAVLGFNRDSEYVTTIETNVIINDGDYTPSNNPVALTRKMTLDPGEGVDDGIKQTATWAAQDIGTLSNMIPASEQMPLLANAALMAVTENYPAQAEFLSDMNVTDVAPVPTDTSKFNVTTNKGTTEVDAFVAMDFKLLDSSNSPVDAANANVTIEASGDVSVLKNQAAFAMHVAGYEDIMAGGDFSKAAVEIGDITTAPQAEAYQTGGTAAVSDAASAEAPDFTMFDSNYVRAEFTNTNLSPFLIIAAGVIPQDGNNDNNENNGNNENSSGSGGGGGGSTKITVPLSGDENSINITVRLSGSKAIIDEINRDELEKVLNGESSTGVIKIDLTGLNREIDTVDFPVNSLKTILEAAEQGENDTERLEFHLTTGIISLDDKAMRTVVEQAECDTVRFVIKDEGTSLLNAEQKSAVEDMDVHGCVEVYILCVDGDKKISDFNGGVIILKVPFKVPDGLNAKYFCIWHVDDEGNLEKLDTNYENGYLLWTVDKM